MSNSTISGNSTNLSGGGIDNAGTLRLQNTIVAGNTGNSATADIGGTITTDSGHNLLGTAVNNSTTDPTPGKGDVFNDTPLLAPLGLEQAKDWVSAHEIARFRGDLATLQKNAVMISSERPHKWC